MAGNTTPVTNLAQTIENTILRKLGDVHTSIPGNVARYDPVKQVADIEIAVKRKVASDGSGITIPIIKNVPVRFPRSGKYSIHFPLEKGDRVHVLFCERSLDNWKKSGMRVSEPADVPRFFDYSDAVAIPGLYPDSEPIAFDDATEQDGMTLQSETMKISLTSDGKVVIGKSGSTQEEPLVLGNVMISALTDIVAQVKQIATDIKTGPVGIGNAGSPTPTHPALIVKLAAIEAALDTIKSTYIDAASTNIISQISFTERGA